jgi:hypothetical protein
MTENITDDICMELILLRDHQVLHRGGCHLDYKTIRYHHMEHLGRMKSTIWILCFFVLKLFSAKKYKGHFTPAGDW